MTYNTTKPFLLIASITILIILTGLSCAIGVADFVRDFDVDWLLLFQSRLPRSIAIILTGAALGISGLLLQVLFNNRFVEPSMIGTAQGSALGLLAMLIFFPATHIIVTMTVASISGLLATLMFLLLVRKVPAHNTLLIPLVGIIYAGILTSIGVFIAYEGNLLQMFDAWLNGEFSGVIIGRYELLWAALAIMILAYYCADRLTIAGLGAATAKNLGLNYHQTLKIGLIMVTVIIATVVVTIGNIPFLGLIAPNIIRRFLGDNLHKSLPWVAYLGAVLLLICDIISRSINYPYEIPVSLVMGIIGTIIFLFLLFHKGSQYG